MIDESIFKAPNPAFCIFHLLMKELSERYFCQIKLVKMTQEYFFFKTNKFSKSINYSFIMTLELFKVSFYFFIFKATFL